MSSVERTVEEYPIIESWNCFRKKIMGNRYFFSSDEVVGLGCTRSIKLHVIQENVMETWNAIEDVWNNTREFIVSNIQH